MGGPWVLKWTFLILGVAFTRCECRRGQNKRGDESQQPGQKDVKENNWSYLGSPRKGIGVLLLRQRRRNDSLPLTSPQRLPGGSGQLFWDISGKGVTGEKAWR